MEQAVLKDDNWVVSNFGLIESGSNGSQASASGCPLTILRRKAFDQFAQFGFPKASLEEWKYTNIAPFVSLPFALSQKDETDLSAGSIIDNVSLLDNRLVFVNGHFSKELSKFELSQEQIEFGSFRSLVSENKDVASKLGQGLGQLAKFEDKNQSAVAYNTAFIQDGAFIRVKRGVQVEQPVQIVFLSLPADKPMATHPRFFVELEEGSSLQLVENYLGTDGVSCFTSVVGELELAQDARLDHYKLQQEGDETLHLSSLFIKQATNSDYANHNFSLGGLTVRNEIYPILDGEQINSTLNGLNILDAEQHVDNYTVIDHSKPHSESSELYKGIYAGKSKGVFSGTIIVRPDAQKTNAFQSNQSLLLSERAVSNSRPQLKIWADDVKCSHGATVGQIDKEALFYLRARGIPEATAKSMLMRAFVVEVLDGIKIPSLREKIEGLVEEKLVAVQL